MLVKRLGENVGKLPFGAYMPQGNITLSLMIS
jgi:hypothetical protein